MALTPASVPAFPRGVKYRLDVARAVWVLLTPEKVMMPDDHAQAVLAAIDGERSVTMIVTDLASRYDTPADIITADVLELLDDLAAGGVIVDRRHRA